MRPDRVVVGVQNPRAAEVMNEIYRPLFLRDFPIVVTDLESAELIKYAANAFLAAKITFINEIAALCERVGADVHDVARGIGLDGRIGRKFLHPGPGYGGSCFPKDIRALQHTGLAAGMPLQILGAVERVNEAQKQLLGEKIAARLGADLRGRSIAVWGLAFKPNTDDMREAPSVEIAGRLMHEGARVKAYDPAAMRNAARVLDGVQLAEDAYDLASGCDAVVVVTDWNEFKHLDMARLKASMAEPVLIDGRNIYEPSKMQELGFTYRGIGRGYEKAEPSQPAEILGAGESIELEEAADNVS